MFGFLMDAALGSAFCDTNRYLDYTWYHEETKKIVLKGNKKKQAALVRVRKKRRRID